jgi:hypothetical protein
MTKKEVTYANALDWANSFPHVRTWLAKLQKPQHKAWWLYLFCHWSNKNPEELLALKDNVNSRDAETILDQFVADANTGLTNAVRWGCVNAVKSFFRNNYRDLARACGQITLEKVHPYRKPTKEELMKLWKACTNPRDRAIISMLNCTAIAKETLVKLKWNHIEEGWENIDVPHISIPDVLLKGHGVGRYRGVEQHTFLTPEAKEDLKEYKEFMEKLRGVKLTRDMNVFLHIHKPYDPINYDFLGQQIVAISRRAGVPFSPHDARRYVQTALEESKINPNWARKVRGRKVRGEEAPYSRPELEKLRQAYKEAIPLLQFRETHTGLEERVKAIEELTKTLTPEQRETMGRFGIRLASQRETQIKPKVKKIKMDETQTNGGQACTDGAHCQRLATEEELPQLLNEGWHVITALASGKVVIERRA